MAENPKTKVESSDKSQTFFQNLSIDTSKTPSRSTPSSPLSLRKTASVRNSCLCSPTTHAGSFRCRLHRAHPGLRHGSMSVGSKLSELAGKSDGGSS
ncbi:serine-rich protein-related [Striga hermonthica]|uniref:Serine-rich protein-related n=1 Tax=Striga hermonthica TaxID=68872 RepID=A0A9N7NUA2_STRHE|nr:serine-rich protein-related [Striga hermonthica]